MKLYLNYPQYLYEIENICRLFFPGEKIEWTQELSNEMPSASVNFMEKGDSIEIWCSSRAFGFEESTVQYIQKNIVDFEKECERLAAVGLYAVFSKLCGFSPKWGILTGVRPAKLLSTLVKDYGSKERAVEYFQKKLLVTDEKTELCLKVLEAEKRSLVFTNPNSFSLYVSIPFCPSRCSYCSFVSHSIAKAGRLIPQYTELLCKEIENTAKIAAQLGLSLSTIYFGGGTPTQLSADQLAKIMETISESFDLTHLVEYTVEAGRPDTITTEKLKVLKRGGATRISINPQTLHDDILMVIGRRHTVQQSVDALHLARVEGFNNINMDIIAGLPGDSIDRFLETVDGILSLSPENITVHTLSLKRSSGMVQSGRAVYAADSIMVSDMLEQCSQRLTENRYFPYYLYRQSKMLGNHENVGWSKNNDTDCLYNIYMMNELHTVLAVGAGGVSRLKDPYGSQIERIFNFKYPYEYIERFDEILSRKNKVGDFYEKYPYKWTSSTGQH